MSNVERLAQVLQLGGPRLSGGLRKFLKKLIERCAWIVSHPERFPELKLAGQLRLRMPRRRGTRRVFYNRPFLQRVARVMKAECSRMDIPSRRVGTLRQDDSVLGLSWAAVAKRARLGRGPRKKQPHRQHWHGKTAVARVFRATHGYFEWKVPEQRSPRNPRFKNKKTGRWTSYPTVRKISMLFLKRVKLDRTYEKEQADAVEYRRDNPVIDLAARRARHRRIYAARREKQAIAARAAKISARELAHEKSTRKQE